MSNAMSRFCCAEYATFKFGKWGSLDLFGLAIETKLRSAFITDLSGLLQVQGAHDPQAWGMLKVFPPQSKAILSKCTISIKNNVRTIL